MLAAWLILWLGSNWMANSTVTAQYSLAPRHCILLEEEGTRHQSIVGQWPFRLDGTPYFILIDPHKLYILR